MKAMTPETGAKRPFSKIDASGTDPNRYASVSNPVEAEPYTTEHDRNPSPIPGLKANVGLVERFLTAAAGTYLLYSGLSGKNKSAIKTTAGGALLARAITGYCPGYALAHRNGKLKSRNVNIRTMVDIDRPVQEVYEFWRKLENLPRFMSHLDSVQELDRITSEWTAKGPAGIGHVSWKAQILMDEPGKLLSWHSLPDSTVENAGKVYFHDNERGGTELDVTISYHAPLGLAGEATARLLNPLFEKMVRSDIEGLKDYLENESAS